MITKRKFFWINRYTLILILAVIMILGGIISAFLWGAVNLIITVFGLAIGLITWFKGSQSYKHLLTIK